MQRQCAGCGVTFEAQRSSARYCGATCRQRGNRRRKTQDVVSLPIGLVGSVQRELEAAGRLNSSLGQQALRLAERMTGQFDTGTAIAALSRELRSVMAEALKDSSVAADPMDELADRRARRVGRA